METVIDVAKLVSLALVLSLLLALLGGWLLRLLAPWDKEQLPDGERPIDFTGRRW